MTLGSRLSTTLKDLAAANIAASQARDAAQLEAARQKRAALTSTTEAIRAHITTKIEQGLVPSCKITDYDAQKWIESAQKGRAAHQDIWNALLDWAKAEEIAITVRMQHDGAGIQSWILIKANPLA